MKEKKTMIAIIIVCGAMAYVLYLAITADDGATDTLSHCLMPISAGFMVLSDLLLGQGNHRRVTLSEETRTKLMENEDYVLAANRLDIGYKMCVTGGLMVGIPLLVLLVTGHLEGFLATLFVISFFVGIIIFVIGAVLTFMGFGYTPKIPVEEMPELQPKSKASQICSTISMIGMIIWVILRIIEWCMK